MPQKEDIWDDVEFGTDGSITIKSLGERIDPSSLDPGIDIASYIEGRMRAVSRGGTIKKAQQALSKVPPPPRIDPSRQSFNLTPNQQLDARQIANPPENNIRNIGSQERPLYSAPGLPTQLLEMLFPNTPTVVNTGSKENPVFEGRPRTTQEAEANTMGTMMGMRYGPAFARSNKLFGARLLPPVRSGAGRMVRNPANIPMPKIDPAKATRQALKFAREHPTALRRLGLGAIIEALRGGKDVKDLMTLVNP